MYQTLMKKYLFTILFSCLLINAYAQSTATDSISPLYESYINEGKYREAAKLGLQYFLTNNYKDAALIFENIVTQYSKNPLAYNPNDFVIYTGKLSDCYISMDEWAKADRLLTETINLLFKNNIKTNAVRYLWARQGIVQIYLNNYKSALTSLYNAKRLFDIINDHGPEYGSVLSSLSTIYFQDKDYLNAKLFADEAVNIIKNLNGTLALLSGKHLCLNNIALIYSQLGCYKEATNILENVIKEKKENNYHGELGLIYGNLGDIYMLQGDYKKAKEYVEKSLSYSMNLITEINIMGDYLFILKLTKDPSYSKILQEYNTKQKAYIASILSSFSDSEWENYWDRQVILLTSLNNLDLNVENNQRQAILAYNNNLYTKGLLLHSNNLIKQIVYNANNKTDIKNIYNKIQGLKELLIDRATDKDSIPNIQIKLINTQKELLSKVDLTSYLNKGFKDFYNVRNSLKDNEVAIEFVYMPETLSPKKISPNYGALVIRKDYEAPIPIKLCNVDLFDDLVASMANNQDLSLYDIKDTRIYNLLWKDLMPYIHKGDIVYYATSSSINNINHKAISNGSNRLSDIYKMYLLSSTANIAELKREKLDDYKSAVIYGGINYNEPADDMVMEARKYKTISRSNQDMLALRGNTTRGSWDLLPGTLEEAKNINGILTSKGIPTTLFTDNQANEESIKNLSGNSPAILHIATHGFYVESPKTTNHGKSFFDGLIGNTKRDVSMYHCGLLFAGANTTWTGHAPKNSEDGILTADELSRIDLSNTQLSILSACKTGLGEIGFVDGIYGLQRALKQAGVQSIIMSLWNVDDKITVKLMDSFYKNLTNGIERHAAFQKSIDTIRKEFPNPKYWAAWVMLD